MTFTIIYWLIAAGIGYIILMIVFDILLRGFSPFVPSRPWVVDQLLSEIKIEKEKPIFIALSSGRSGFFRAMEKKYPEAKLIGVETNWFPDIVAKAQALIRFSRIKIKHEAVHRVNVKEADFIYCHLYPDEMRGLGKKLKYECRPDTIIISTGFNIPILIPAKVVALPDRRGKLDWLSKNQKLLQKKSQKFKKEKKAYFYVI